MLVLCVWFCLSSLAGSPPSCRGLETSPLALWCPQRPTAPLQLTHSTSCLVRKSNINYCCWCTLILKDPMKTHLMMRCVCSSELLSAGNVTARQSKPYSNISVNPAHLRMSAWTYRHIKSFKLQSRRRKVPVLFQNGWSFNVETKPVF